MEFYDKHTTTEYQGKSLEDAAGLVDLLARSIDYPGKSID
jgi:hypothetical protein